MTIKELRDRNLILLECISGSKAYGLDTPASDTDIKGIFLLPKKQFYGLERTEQVSNATNDIVFYEWRRFTELLAVNNPNILELLNTPEEAILYKSPLLDKIDPTKVLSKKCRDTFGKYAISQIKKAKGLQKKIVNPVDKERKTPLDFCFVNYRNGSVPVSKFLALRDWKQEDCGLVKISHMNNVFGLYHSRSLPYAGIIRSKKSNDLALSSVPKGEEQAALLYFNRNGYSTYCKQYREYWEWTEKRNEERYRNTQSHGKNYDAKNMMHTFRLLNMAIEIAEHKQIRVRRDDRDFLLRIKAGDFTYEELLHLANEKQTAAERAFAASDLPDFPDLAYINELTFQVRARAYEEADKQRCITPSE